MNRRRVPRPASLRDIIEAIAALDDAKALRLLANNPGLAKEAKPKGATRADGERNFFSSISHYVYAGDTALHMAAAAQGAVVVAALLAAGADPNALNRRAATPLHYACDGGPGPDGEGPRDPAAVISALVKAGSDVNRPDRSGTAPLHRAIRNRSSRAVAQLLKLGADPLQKNKSGSTPGRLARLTTGKSGSGSPEAKAAQRRIMELLGSARPREADRLHDSRSLKAKE